MEKSSVVSKVKKTSAKSDATAAKRGPKPKPGSHKIDKNSCRVCPLFIPAEYFSELEAEAEKTNSDVASVIRTILFRAKKWPALERNG